MSTTVSPPSSSFSSKSLPNFPSSPKTNNQTRETTIEALKTYFPYIHTLFSECVYTFYFINENFVSKKREAYLKV